jgi:CRISPR/Cas system endoribonuclease Cas6 (RAMP superfamily)
LLKRAGLDVALPYLMEKLLESCAAHWLKGESIIFLKFIKE